MEQGEWSIESEFKRSWVKSEDMGDELTVFSCQYSDTEAGGRVFGRCDKLTGHDAGGKRAQTLGMKAEPETEGQGCGTA
jgi:hypothetical protein